MDSYALALEELTLRRALSAHATLHELRVVRRADQLERTQGWGEEMRHVIKIWWRIARKSYQNRQSLPKRQRRRPQPGKNAPACPTRASGGLLSAIRQAVCPEGHRARQGYLVARTVGIRNLRPAPRRQPLRFRALAFAGVYPARSIRLCFACLNQIHDRLRRHCQSSFASTKDSGKIDPLPVCSRLVHTPPSDPNAKAAAPIRTKKFVSALF